MYRARKTFGLLLGAGLLCAVGVMVLLGPKLPGGGGGSAGDGVLIPSAAERDFRYQHDYPAVGYSSMLPSEAVADLQRRLDSGEVELRFDATHGYLPSLLEALVIDPSSQVLVFSRTSVNAPYIRPENPRAIYFNDSTYVGWVPGSGMIEIASMDPDIGAIFFSFEQKETDRPAVDRETFQCLRCHDSYTLTGGGVPRLILGSGYTDVNGNLVSHEGWRLTDQKTPLKYRWGGWYATGQHGDQVHLGNMVVESPDDLRDLASLRRGNLESLEPLIDAKQYLTSQSDIVALLVLQHQVDVHNAINRVNFGVRSLLHGEDAAEYADQDQHAVPVELRARVADLVEPLVQAMLLAEEAPLQERIEGAAGFAEQFEARGPKDSNGRSLRDLDLSARLFRYPLSYLVYSPEFDGLPELARVQIYRRFAHVLLGRDTSPEFARITQEDRRDILEILRETKSGFARVLEQFSKKVD